MNKHWFAYLKINYFNSPKCSTVLFNIYKTGSHIYVTWSKLILTKKKKNHLRTCQDFLPRTLILHLCHSDKALRSKLSTSTQGPTGYTTATSIPWLMSVAIRNPPLPKGWHGFFAPGLFHLSNVVRIQMVCVLKGETHAEDLFNEFKPNWKPPSWDSFTVMGSKLCKWNQQRQLDNTAFSKRAFIDCNLRCT